MHPRGRGGLTGAPGRSNARVNVQDTSPVTLAFSTLLGLLEAYQHARVQLLRFAIYRGGLLCTLELHLVRCIMRYGFEQARVYSPSTRDNMELFSMANIILFIYGLSAAQSPFLLSDQCHDGDECNLLPILFCTERAPNIYKVSLSWLAYSSCLLLSFLVASNRPHRIQLPLSYSKHESVAISSGRV